jgi:hypothetical protein
MLVWRVFPILPSASLLVPMSAVLSIENVVILLAKSLQGDKRNLYSALWLCWSGQKSCFRPFGAMLRTALPAKVLVRRIRQQYPAVFNTFRAALWSSILLDDIPQDGPLQWGGSNQSHSRLAIAFLLRHHPSAIAASRAFIVIRVSLGLATL